MATRRRKRVNGELESQTIELRSAQEQNIESLTIGYGEEVYSPVQYNSFRVGGHHVTISPLEGESTEEMVARGRKVLETLANAEFEHRLETFRKNLAVAKR